MSLSLLAPTQRWKIRLLGWLIVMAAMGLAAGFNVLLRHAWPDLPPLVRHLCNAMFMYFGGLLPLMYFYLRWQSRTPQNCEPLAASEQEAQAYEEERKQVQEWTHLTGLTSNGVGSLLSLGEWMPALFILGLIVALLLIAPYVLLSPILVTEFLASVLAEVLFEFVLAYALIRRQLNIPATTALTYGALFKRTWLYGLVIVALGVRWGGYRQFHA